MRRLMAMLTMVAIVAAAASAQARKARKMTFDAMGRWTSGNVEVKRQDLTERASIACGAGWPGQARMVTFTVRDSNGKTLVSETRGNCDDPADPATCTGEGADFSLGDLDDGIVTIEINWTPEKTRLKGRCLLIYLTDDTGDPPPTI